MFSTKLTVFAFFFAFLALSQALPINENDGRLKRQIMGSGMGGGMNGGMDRMDRGGFGNGGGDTVERERIERPGPLGGLAGGLLGGGDVVERERVVDNDRGFGN